MLNPTSPLQSDLDFYISPRGRLRCPFCRRVLAKDLNGLWELEGYSEHWCSEYFQFNEQVRKPAQWRAWHALTGCPEEVTPRQFVWETQKTCTTPPDRTEWSWHEEIDEILSSSREDLELQFLLEWSLPTGRSFYFKGYRFYMAEPGVPNTLYRVWDNKPVDDSPLYEEIIAAERAANKAIRDIRSRRQFLALLLELYPDTVYYTGSFSRREVEGLARLLSEESHWNVFGVRDPVDVIG